MENETTKTPYNTIYEPLKSKKQKCGDLCCVHGGNCIYGKQDLKPDDNQYVYLGSPKNEDGIGSKLTEKLNKLADEQSLEPRGKPELMSLNGLMMINEKKKKGKNEREKKKKRSNVVVDDSQSYVLIDTSTTEDPNSQSIQSTPIPVSSNEISVITQKNDNIKISEATSAYIGILSLSDAENRLTNRGEFALYHLFTPNSLDSLTDRLPLMLVYRTTTKKNRHYSIRLTADRQFFVDCGYPNVRKHFSLNHLVMFYKFSAMIEINPDDTSSDSFSWWLE